MSLQCYVSLLPDGPLANFGPRMVNPALSGADPYSLPPSTPMPGTMQRPPLGVPNASMPPRNTQSPQQQQPPPPGPGQGPGGLGPGQAPGQGPGGLPQLPSNPTTPNPTSHSAALKISQQELQQALKNRHQQVHTMCR